MNATTKVNSREITPNLTCQICKGYFIDATTIIECLHSFCKSCIVKHLEKSEYCPVCDVQLHTSKPLSSIRSDQMLQEVVYKLVPGLFQNEMQRRRKFYKENAESKPISQVDSGHVYNETYITSDDIIHLSLEHYTDDVEFRKSTKRFIKCPAAVSISILKKLIHAKYDLGKEALIEVMYGERILPDDFLLMDIAYKYSWTQNGKPLQLCYRVKGPSSVFKPVLKSNTISEELITTNTESSSNKDNSSNNLASIESIAKVLLVKKHRQSRATGTNAVSTSPCINTNGVGMMGTISHHIVTNGIGNGEATTTTPKSSQTHLATNGNDLTARGRRKKKAALVETNNQTDLNAANLANKNLLVTPKLKSKVKSIRNKKDVTGKVETKEKEVQLRISENGVYSVISASLSSARNVASGEEKIILGTPNTNNIIGSSSSPMLTSTTTTTTTTIISPATAALASAAASPAINIHIPNSNINHNGLVITPGPRLMNNNSLVNKCSNNTNLHTTSILSNLKQQQQQGQLVVVGNNFKPDRPKQKKKNYGHNPLSLSRKRFQNIDGTPSMPGGTIPIAAAITKAAIMPGKKKDANNMGNKVVKVPTKRKLVNSSTSISKGGISSSSGGAGISNNMETLKAVSKRMKEELEPKGMNYFSAEITPIINGTPSSKVVSIAEATGQHFQSATVCNFIPTTAATTTTTPNANVMMGNFNKRLQQQAPPSTTMMNGDHHVKYMSTTPTKKYLLSSSPNAKIFPKSNSSNNNSPSTIDRQKNYSPSVSPKKPPKFFKSRHNTADANTTTTTTIMGSSPDNYFAGGIGTSGGGSSYCVSNSISNGSSHIHNSNKKVKQNHIMNSSIEQQQQNVIISPSSAISTTVMSTAAVPIMSMPSTQSLTNTTTAGQPGPFRFPLHMSFQNNGMPMNLVPFVTSNYCSMPFLDSLNNLKNVNNIPSAHPFLEHSLNPFLDFATVAQLQQSLSQSLQSNSNDIGGNVNNLSTISTTTSSSSTNNNNSTLDLSISKAHHLPTISTNGTTIIVPHPIQNSSHLQNLHIAPTTTTTQSTMLLSSNNRLNYSLNARIDSSAAATTTATTASDNEQHHTIILSSAKQVPSAALVGNVSNTTANNNSFLESPTNTKSLNSPNATLNQTVDHTNKNGSLLHHPSGKSTSGGASSGGLFTKIKLNEFEPPSITNSLVAAQNLMKGIHNLGLGVNFNNLGNSSTPKNSRKSASPAKLGRGNVNNLKVSVTPEKSAPTNITTTINVGTCAAAEETPVSMVESNPTQHGIGNNGKVDDLVTTDDTGSNPAPSNGIVDNGNPVTPTSVGSTNSLSGVKVNNHLNDDLENGHADDCSKNENVCNGNNEPSLTPSVTNGMDEETPLLSEIKDDNVSSSGSDEFAMQIDEECPISTDGDVHNVNSSNNNNDTSNESAHNTNVYNNNVAKDSSPPMANNNNNNNVSQNESSSTTTSSA